MRLPLGGPISIARWFIGLVWFAFTTDEHSRFGGR